MPELIVLDNSSISVQYLCQKDKRIAKVISMVGPISYSPNTDGFSFLIHEVIEQMLSIKVGKAIYERLQFLCNGEITPIAINGLSDEEIKSTGTSYPKGDPRKFCVKRE